MENCPSVRVADPGALHFTVPLFAKPQITARTGVSSDRGYKDGED